MLDEDLPPSVYFNFINSEKVLDIFKKLKLADRTKWSTMYSLLSQGLAGIQAVNVPGIENVSSLIPIPFYICNCRFALVYIALS